MSTPQTSVLLLERACCRIWRTTSLLTSRVGCEFNGFAFALMTQAARGQSGPNPAGPRHAAHRHSECKRAPAQQYAQRKRQTMAIPTCLMACLLILAPPNTNAMRSRHATAHRSYILPVQKERFPPA